jgi:hypothetical protein
MVFVTRGKGIGPSCVAGLSEGHLDEARVVGEVREAPLDHRLFLDAHRAVGAGEEDFGHAAAASLCTRAYLPCICQSSPPSRRRFRRATWRALVLERTKPPGHRPPPDAVGGELHRSSGGKDGLPEHARVGEVRR